MPRRLPSKPVMIGLMLGLLPARAGAEVPEFTIVPEKSALKFVATQNDAPVEGGFAKFYGAIAFNPARPEECRIHVEVETGNVTTGYEEVAKTLPMRDWFDSPKFPRAVYDAAGCQVKEGDAKSFVAKGKLTIRDRSQLLDLPFSLTHYSAEAAGATGTVELKRNAYGVGQGDWADTGAVKDEVTISFTVEAVKK